MKGLHLNVMCVCVIIVAVLIAYHVGTTHSTCTEHETDMELVDGVDMSPACKARSNFDPALAFTPEDCAKFTEKGEVRDNQAPRNTCIGAVNNIGGSVCYWDEKAALHLALLQEQTQRDGLAALATLKSTVCAQCAPCRLAEKWQEAVFAKLVKDGYVGELVPPVCPPTSESDTMITGPDGGQIDERGSSYGRGRYGL